MKFIFTVMPTNNYICLCLLLGLVAFNANSQHLFGNPSCADWQHLSHSHNHKKGLFNVRELHDMGSSGVQQIDYLVNCTNQTLALTGFAVITSRGRLTSFAATWSP